MKHLFYGLIILATIYEFGVVAEPKKILYFRRRMKDKKANEYTTTESAYSILNMGYMIITFIGLLSSQWVCFLLILFMSLAYKKKSVWVTFTDALLTGLVLLFTILNAYHLHIDIGHKIVYHLNEYFSL